MCRPITLRSLRARSTTSTIHHFHHAKEATKKNPRRSGPGSGGGSQRPGSGPESLYRGWTTLPSPCLPPLCRPPRWPSLSRPLGVRTEGRGPFSQGR